MTQPNAIPEKPLHLRLPGLRIDYASGHFANTQSGEIEQCLTGVILAYREDRVLWPSLNDSNPTPLCVNGSEYGPCFSCAHARFSRDGTPPACSEELTILLRLAEGSVATLTARRSMMRPIDQYLGMHELLGTELYSQEMQLYLSRPASDPLNALYALRLAPGPYLEREPLARLGELAARVDEQFRQGALS